ncbi:M48 family metalloprotease [Gracilimonas sp.]|uniref:M48 family metalloprotease n=1 Tax=Gracilimonas sp. TaxID=1974203 RepID=UPI002870D335|nr:M48 family metalloprotease [Gracilimonas sp.]
MRPRSFFGTLTLTFAILINACVTMEVNPVSGNKRVFGYTWEQEVELGENADSEIIAQYGLYENEALTDYVSELGQELLKVSHLRREGVAQKFQETEFTFRVLNSPVVNAFALPGGYIYVTRGLLGHLNNEAQLAMVIGHEIAHVAARHASQRAATQQIGQLAIIGGAILGESLGYDGGDILQLSSQTAQLLFLKYSRDAERESDALGVEYSAMKNYQAAEGADFFTSLKRITENQGGGIPTLQSSHPDPGEREETIPRLAQEWAEKGYEQTILDKEEFLSMISGIVYGENPREGFNRDGMFYHPDLEFQFPVPEGFNLQNQTSAVVMFNEAQDAIMQFTIDSENESPEASVNAFLAQEGITVIEQQNIESSRYNGYRGEATAQMEDGTMLTLQLTALAHQGNVYRFLSYSTSDQFPDYETIFEEVSSGFEELTDTEVLNIQPVRLELMTTSSRATFSDLLPDELPMNITPLDMAIVNQVNLDQTIEAGTTLKMPVQ